MYKVLNKIQYQKEAAVGTSKNTDFLYYQELFFSFKCTLVSFHFPFIVKTFMFQLEISIALI